MSPAEHAHITDRRTLLAGIAAAPVTAVMGYELAAPQEVVSAEVQVDSPRLALWQEMRRLGAEIKSEEMNFDESRAHNDRYCDLWDEVARPPARSPEDFRVKVAFCRSEIDDDPGFADPKSIALISLFHDIERALLTGQLA